MHRYREPIWMETVVSDAIDKLAEVVSDPIRDTPLEYWLLYHQGQATTFFLALLLGSMIWVILLEKSIRHTSNLVLDAALSGGKDGKLNDPDCVGTPTTSRDGNDVTPHSTGDTPIMRKLAPPGHRPTNAQLNISSFHLVQNLFAASGAATHPTLPRQSESTGQVHSTATAASWDTFSEEETPSSSHLHGRNFARLAKDAPVSYETLREKGMLDKDGSPTRKFRLHELLA